MECPACGETNREGARFCDSCGESLAVAERKPERTAPVDGPAPLPADAPESLGDGRYALKGFLGQGGGKRVFLAEDSREGREVAAAIYNTEGMDETVLARARREAQAMSKLGSHPHIVTVYDSGEENEAPYIVSQYMPGGDLAGLCASAEGGRLSIQRALEIAEDLCRALEHAHGRAIVHRDLKPANVWLAEDGSATLGDFGLATTVGRSRANLESKLVGTVAYLPPEQALGRASDARADLYSLGAVLYEMLAGQPPFPGDDAVAIIGQHLNAAPVAPSRHNGAVPPALDDLVLKLLAKSPADRPESAAAVRAELDAVRAAPTPEPSETEAREEENPLSGLAGGIFVGRERELEELRSSVDDALAGRGRLMLLVGEPGIGKTRTADELATYAQVRGAKVHWGRCHEGEGAPAYWPWVEAIRSYVREADPVALQWEMGQGGAEIAQVVPEVAELLGKEPAAGESELEPEQARFRLFDAITTFLTGAARSRPIVLILDDLHWADESSLLLLQFLARSLGGSGLLVVATYRDVELGRHHPLAKVLGELAGTEQSSRVTLRGLEVEDVARYIEMSSGAAPSHGLAEAVHEQTEGNPFFVSEVVRLLVSEGTLAADDHGGRWELAIPQGVREVVGRRLDRLSDDANQVLTIAAAVGRQFRLDALERVNGRPREDIEMALNEAVEAQLLAPAGRDRFGFSHALVRETLYEEIAAARRVQLHGRIGEALEELYIEDPEPYLAELAHHFLEAATGGDCEKAVQYAARAAERATRQLAYEEAAEIYERALDVVDTTGHSDDRARGWLSLALGEAQTRAGRFAEARVPLDRAAEAAQSLGDAELLAKAAVAIVRISEIGGVDEPLVALIEEALRELPEGDSALRSRLLSGLGQEVYWGDPERARELNREAVEMARRIDDPTALTRALMGQVIVTIGADRAEERLAVADELEELGRRTGDREMELRGHLYRLRELLEQGDVAGVDRELDAYERIADELRMPAHLWHVPLMRAMRALIDGRFEEAERLAGEAAAGGQRAQEPLSAQLLALQLSLIRRFQGRMEELLPEVERLADRYPAIPAWRLALVNLYTELDRREEARAAFERLASSDFEDIKHDAQYLASLTLSAESCAYLGDKGRAAALREMIEPYAAMSVVVGPAAACYGPVTRYLGLLDTTLERYDDAERQFEAAAAMCRRMGDRPFAASVRLNHAQALLARGRADDRERALELLGPCLDEAQELGLRAIVDRGLKLKLEAQGLAEVDVTTSIDVVISAVESERPDLRAHAAPDGTVTILFSDIEDSTLLTERLGDERWLEVLRAHNGVFRERLRAHDGYEVKSQGDGFMLVFPDPAGALRCAIEVQRQLTARAEAETDAPIRVRMGLHTGEVVHEEGDVFGRNVILAARIAAKATGGEILVSSALRDAAGADGLSFDDGRELELKGLTGTHRVYRADWQDESETAATGA